MLNERRTTRARPPAEQVESLRRTAEAARLAELAQYQIVDTMPEQAFDDLTILAATACQSPIAAITLMDEQRFWMKSKFGTSIKACDRHRAFCAHTVLSSDAVSQIEDASIDPDFANNPMYSDGEQVKFYAGVPLTNSRGFVLGTICVMDRRPRSLACQEKKALKALGRQTVALLELRRANAELALQGQTDALTGVPNRRAFDQRLRLEWQRHATQQLELSVAIVDIDHFKSINDGYGHGTGDEVLVLCGQAISAALRPQDSLARVGGEEFAILMPETDAAEAFKVAERIRASIGDLRYGTKQTAVSASIGVASGFPELSNNPYSMMSIADEALYVAKRAGRDQVAARPLPVR